MLKWPMFLQNNHIEVTYKFWQKKFEFLNTAITIYNYFTQEYMYIYIYIWRIWRIKIRNTGLKTERWLYACAIFLGSWLHARGGLLHVLLSLPESDRSGKSARLGPTLPRLTITESLGSRYKPLALVRSVKYQYRFVNETVLFLSGYLW